MRKHVHHQLTLGRHFQLQSTLGLHLTVHVAKMTMDKYILDAVRTLRTKKLRSSFGEIFTFIKCHDDGITIDVFRETFDKLEEHGYIFKKNKTDSYYLGDLSRKSSFLMANNGKNSDNSNNNGNHSSNSNKSSYEKKSGKEIKSSPPVYGFNGHKLNEQEEYDEVEKFYLNEKEKTESETCGDKNNELIIKKCGKDNNKIELKLPCNDNKNEKVKKLSSSSFTKERKTSNSKHSGNMVEGIKNEEHNKGDKNTCGGKDKNHKRNAKTECCDEDEEQALGKKKKTNADLKNEKHAKKQTSRKEDWVLEKLEKRGTKHEKSFVDMGVGITSEQKTTTLNTDNSKTNGERIPRKLPSKGVVEALQTDKLVAQMLEKLREEKEPVISDISEEKLRDVEKHGKNSHNNKQKLKSEENNDIGDRQHHGQHKDGSKRKNSELPRVGGGKTNEHKTRQNSRHRMTVERKKSMTENRSRKSSTEKRREKSEDKKAEEEPVLNRLGPSKGSGTNDTQKETDARSKEEIPNKNLSLESDDEGVEMDLTDNAKNKTDMILSLLSKERQITKAHDDTEEKEGRGWLVTDMKENDNDQIAALLNKMKSDYAIKKKSDIEEQQLINSSAEILFEPHGGLTKIEEHVMSVSYDVAIPTRHSNVNGNIFDEKSDDSVLSNGIKDKVALALNNKDTVKNKTSNSNRKFVGNKERCSKYKNDSGAAEDHSADIRKNAIAKRLISGNYEAAQDSIQAEPKMDAILDKPIDTKIDTKMNTKVNPKSVTKNDTKTGTEIGTELETKDASTQTTRDDEDSELFALIKNNLRECKKKKSQETKTRDQLYIGFMKNEMDFLKSEIKHKNEFISKLLAQKEEKKQKKDSSEEVKVKSDESCLKKDSFSKDFSSLKGGATTKSLTSKLTLPASPTIETGHKQKTKKENNFLMKENFIENKFMLNNDCNSDLNNNENNSKQNNKSGDNNTNEKKTINDSINEKNNNNENTTNIPRRENGRKTWKAPPGRLPRVESMVRNLNQSRPKVSRSASMNNMSSTTTTISSSSNHECGAARGNTTTVVATTNDEIDSKTNNKKSNIVICHIGCNDLSKNVDSIPNLETLVNRLMKKTPHNKMINSLVPRKERASLKKKYPIIWKI